MRYVFDNVRNLKLTITSDLSGKTPTSMMSIEAYIANPEQTVAAGLATSTNDPTVMRCLNELVLAVAQFLDRDLSSATTPIRSSFPMVSIG